MTDHELCQARADAGRAKSLAATTSPFTIAVRFLGGLSDTQMAAFAAAADLWVEVIVGDLPDVLVDGEVVDDVLILAEGRDIDGPGKVLGMAGPTHVRPREAGPSAFTPVKGVMRFDTADLARMEATGVLGDVITHEMGHVLGIGTLWDLKGLITGAGTADPRFTGAGAIAEYRKLRGGTSDEPVPVENTGGPGTADGHWRERVFGDELMTGFVGDAGNPLSRLTAAALGDFGYAVDVDAADHYALPTPSTVAALLAEAPPGHDVARPTPVVLPAASLDAR
ncbi:leishmanolysin-related zinc metalloendopeptidase [Saccharothrix hoggarensis]|uniref:Leishmanolysin-related zinc metalloendopeptidase n=1 Tax=Saccharothrix hoggarensis TaxID=913853 RepID=A0ABW3QXX0_9PSEU